MTVCPKTKSRSRLRFEFHLILQCPNFRLKLTKTRFLDKIKAHLNWCLLKYWWGAFFFFYGSMLALCQDYHEWCFKVKGQRLYFIIVFFEMWLASFLSLTFFSYCSNKFFCRFSSHLKTPPLSLKTFYLKHLLLMRNKS